MKQFFIVFFSFFLFVQSTMADDKLVLLKGTVRNQDGEPVPHAQVRAGLQEITETETDDEGKYEVYVTQNPLLFYVDVNADSYPPIKHYMVSRSGKRNEFTFVRDFTLYNIVKYQSGTLATIILPVEPDPLLGKFYLIDSISRITYPYQIYFKREYTPQANIPYVLIPERDFEIHTDDYDLSLEPGSYKVDGEDPVYNREVFARFTGTYNTKDVSGFETEYMLLLDSSPDCYLGESGYKGGNVVVGTFHAYFTLRNMSYNPELIFSDGDTGITSHQCTEDTDNTYYNLAGQKIGHKHKKGTLYICNGVKKLVVVN